MKVELAWLFQSFSSIRYILFRNWSSARSNPKEAPPSQYFESSIDVEKPKNSHSEDEHPQPFQHCKPFIHRYQMRLIIIFKFKMDIASLPSDISLVFMAKNLGEF